SGHPSRSDPPRPRAGGRTAGSGGCRRGRRGGRQRRAERRRGGLTMTSPAPFVVALCPTFRHPDLLANSVALWKRQDYPLDRRRLVILDDAGTFDPQRGPGWELHAAPGRFPSLPAKYNALVALAL